MPHELLIDLGRKVTLAGVTYLPRQDMANGRIASCELFGDDGRIASANWPDSTELQTLRFKQPVSTRTLRLVIQSEVHGNAFASAAEIDVLLQ